MSEFEVMCRLVSHTYPDWFISPGDRRTVTLVLHISWLSDHYLSLLSLIPCAVITTQNISTGHTRRTTVHLARWKGRTGPAAATNGEINQAKHIECPDNLIRIHDIHISRYSTSQTESRPHLSDQDDLFQHVGQGPLMVSNRITYETACIPSYYGRNIRYPHVRI